MPDTPDPIATVEIDGAEKRIQFDINCLLRIERETGRPAMDLLSMMAVPPGTDSGAIAATILRRIPLGVAIDFAAGALNVHADQGRLWARQGVLYKIVIALIPAFVQAAERLLAAFAPEAKEGEPKQGPTPAAGSDAPPPPPPPDGESVLAS